MHMSNLRPLSMMFMLALGACASLAKGEEASAVYQQFNQFSIDTWGAKHEELT